MADLTQILAILQLVEKIIAALRDMGMKINGEVNLAQLLALFPPRG